MPMVQCFYEVQIPLQKNFWFWSPSQQFSSSSCFISRIWIIAVIDGNNQQHKHFNDMHNVHLYQTTNSPNAPCDLKGKLLAGNPISILFYSGILALEKCWPSAFLLQKTMLKSDKIWCKYLLPNCVRLQSFWITFVYLQHMIRPTEHFFSQAVTSEWILNLFFTSQKFYTFPKQISS